MALLVFLCMISVGFGGMACKTGYLPMPVVASLVGLAGIEQTIRAVAELSNGQRCGQVFCKFYVVFTYLVVITGLMYCVLMKLKPEDDSAW